MRSILHAAIAAAALLSTAMLAPASAHEFKLGDLEIVHPHAPAMLPGAKVGGGFMTIVNHGKTGDRLVSASCDCAGQVQLHEMTMENDVMKMREKKDGIAIPAGETVELKHGGLHVMFLDVKSPFMENEMFKATLNFEKAGKVEVEFEVGPPGAGKGHDGKHKKG